MPYGIRKREGPGWEVYNLDTGEVRGHTPTRRKAAQFREALYAHAGDKAMDAADTVVFDGSEVKALDDTGRVGGYLVVFGSPEQTDLSRKRDYFTPETEFDLTFSAKSRVLYHHGLDRTIGPRRLGEGTLEAKDAGVWIEAQLELRDAYERKLFEAVKAKKMSWSSGTINHLVRREAQPNGSHKVLAWPLGLDASITPTPAEPRAMAVALKSLLAEVEAEADAEAKVMSEGDDASGGATAPEATGSKPKREVKPGDGVRWGRYGSMKRGYGTVVSVHSGGNVPGTENDLEATKDAPAAKVHVRERHPSGGDRDTGRHLAHPVSRLRLMPGDTAAKAEHLGDTDETATLAALRAINDTLCMVLYSCVASDEFTGDELVAKVDAVLTEYHEAVIDVVEALLGDETPGDDGGMKASAQSLAREYRERLHAGLSLTDHSDSVLAAAQGLATRFDGLTTLRAAQGRTLSHDRLLALKSLSETLSTLHARAGAVARQDPPSPADVLRLQADLLRIEARECGLL